MIGTLPLLYQTSIGKKVVMAVTGLIWYGYVIAHMLANLKAFAGPEQINAYASFLRVAGEPIFGDEQVLWAARSILLLSIVLHMVAAYQLTRMDLESRPIGYSTRKNVGRGYAASTMRWGGLIIALFIVYHILHLTTGTVHPSFIEGDVYHNLTVGFRIWYVAAIYLVAMIALGFHLHHGVWSMVQTFGLANTGNRRFWRGFAALSAVLIAGGFSLIPIGVITGVLR